MTSTLCCKSHRNDEVNPLERVDCLTLGVLSMFIIHYRSIAGEQALAKPINTISPVSLVQKIGRSSCGGLLRQLSGCLFVCCTSEVACNDAAEFVVYTPQRIIMIVQIFFCTCSVIFNLLFFHYCRKDMFFHKNCRVLIWTLIITNIVHSAVFGGIQGGQLIKMFTVTDPCDMLMSSALCYLLRLPTLVSFGSHLTIHLSLVIERAIALKYLRTYESSKSTTGFALVAFAISSSFGLTVYGTKNYNFTSRMFYCTAATKSTMFDVSATAYFIAAVGAIVMLLFGCVYYLNLRKSVVYDLRSKYQAIENLTVLRLLMPMLLFHFLVFFCFMLSYATSYSIRHLFANDSAFRAYLAAIYIFPIYTACSPLLMGWTLRRHRLSRSQALIRISSKPECANDIYFSNYAWNTK